MIHGNMNLGKYFMKKNEPALTTLSQADSMIQQSPPPPQKKQQQQQQKNKKTLLFESPSSKLALVPALLARYFTRKNIIMDEYTTLRLWATVSKLGGGDYHPPQGTCYNQDSTKQIEVALQRVGSAW